MGLPMYTARTATISVYDPAMCCSTGLCGPGVDPQLLQAFGEKALPVTLINDDIFVYGRYPSRDEVVAALVQQREQEPIAAQNADGGCTCGSGGCC